jgi:hypothetical protein
MAEDQLSIYSFAIVLVAARRMIVLIGYRLCMATEWTGPIEGLYWQALASTNIRI